MAGGRHCEKSNNGQISATVKAINTKFGKLMHIGPRTGPAAKISNL